MLRRIKHYGKIVKNQGVRSLGNLFVAKYYTSKFLPTIVWSGPLWAQIEITNVCNLKCKMCAQSTVSWERHVLKKTLSLEDFKSIIDRLRYIQHAMINGVGEPLLNPHIIDMIKYAHSKGITTGFFTNATLLTADMARKLINTDGFVNLNISLDAANAESFEKIRTGASFSKVCQNVESFIKIRDALGKKTPHVDVWMVPMHDNFHEIPLMLKTISKLGIRNLKLHGFQPNNELDAQSISSEQAKTPYAFAPRSLAEKMIKTALIIQTRTCDEKM